jgi:phosphatidylserine/phosphatidylglycerophosphate/cardiolipin synthase-like enzyme
MMLLKRNPSQRRPNNRHDHRSKGAKAMQKPFFATGLIALVACCLCVQQAQPQAPSRSSAIEVSFSPNGGCTEAVVRQLQAANKTVLVQAYSFTSAPIAKALVEAHQRGVKVQVILDKSQRTEKYSSATFLDNAGIPTFIDAAHAIAHNKVMVIDGGTVITGSFNFTKAAEQHNAENLLVIQDSSLAEKYAANWETHLRHSERYEGRQAAAPQENRPNGRPDSANGYVASKNSQVFHRQSCSSVAKIAAHNLVRYASRDEAIQAGKKPCALCKP